MRLMLSCAYEHCFVMHWELHRLSGAVGVQLCIS
jgi:hypothetical protein